jgi:purine catabolism regulator
METEERGFSCKDLLKIPPLRGAIVLAGKKGLEQTVSRVNVMEVPDVIQWVRPGEFLMTTGYPFRKHPEDLAELIPQLAEKGIAAFGIKTKRYVTEVPEQVLKLADRYGLPLIELPPSTAFSDVVREVMEHVLIREADQVAELQDRFYRISQSMLSDGGLEAFLSALERTLGNPVVLIDSSDRPHLSAKFERIIGNNDQAVDWAQLRQQGKLGISFFPLSGQQVRLYGIEVPEQERHYATLLVLESNREFTALDTLTVDRVGVLAGFELANRNARGIVEAKYIDQFLQDWLVGRIVTRSDLQLRAEACGCPLVNGASYHAAVIHWRGTRPDIGVLRSGLLKLRSMASSSDVTMLLTIIDNELACICSTPQSGTPDREEKWRNSMIRMLQSAFSEPFSICAGPTVRSAELLLESWGKARRTLEMCRVFGLEGEWFDYGRLGVYSLLDLIPDGPELSEFKDRFLHPLKEYDTKHETLLIPTLKAYFQCNANVRRTAETLFTHYNTVVYRLDRVRDILGLDLENADDRLQLQIAIKLHEARGGLLA